MRNGYRHGFCIVALAVFLAAQASFGFAAVSGQLTDTDDKPVAGALVRFVDESDTASNFVCITDSQGRYEVADIVTKAGDGVPLSFRLRQNYPNPFNPSTVIPFELEKSGHVRISVYNALGQNVRTLVNANLNRGVHSALWDGRDDSGRHVAAGLYLYRLAQGNRFETRKMLLIDGGSPYSSKAAVAGASERTARIAVSALRSYRVTVAGAGIDSVQFDHVTFNVWKTRDFVAPRKNSGFHLTVMHTNDGNSHFDKDGNNKYGAAKAAAMADKIRCMRPSTLLLDAGDFATGTIFYVAFFPEMEQRIMNAMGYDAMTLGNHEFDKGPGGLANYLSGITFPVVSANVSFDNEPLLRGRTVPYIVKEFQGRKVGIIGASLPETPLLSSPGDNVVFNPVVTSVQPVVDTLEQQGVNVIILLSHTGYDEDITYASQLKGVDVIVVGHSHAYLSNTDSTAAGPYPTVAASKTAEPVLIVQANDYLKYLGCLHLAFDDNGVVKSYRGSPISLNESVPDDYDIAGYVYRKNEELRPFVQQIVGRTPVELKRVDCLESNIGNLVADSMLWKVSGQGIQIALINGGGIRTDIPEGDITRAKLMEVLPFGNTLATFRISGADLRQAFEQGVSTAVQPADGASIGRFLYMSGARIAWDSTKPQYSRIVSVEVRNIDGSWGVLDDAKEYKVVTNSYIRGGGDGYTVLREKAIQPYDTGLVDIDSLVDYVKAHTPLSPIVEGRIVRK